MTVRLHQFAISHYCEKVRWALDYKGIRYQPVNLLPGRHMDTVRRLGVRDTSVPVLEHNGTVVQGSAAILDYLDETFPDQPLTPADPAALEATRRWEQRLDEDAGPAVRTWSYHYLLQRPKTVIPMLTAGTPFYNRIVLALTFSLVDETMRKHLKINQKTADAAAGTITEVLRELHQTLARQPYLAGPGFSRADLAAGALLAPLFQPPQYPVPWPRQQRLVKAMQDQLQQWQALLEPVAALYQRHR